MISEKQTAAMHRVSGSHAQASGSYSTCSGTTGGLYVGERRKLTGLWKGHVSCFMEAGKPDGRLCGLGLGRGARRERLMVGFRWYLPIGFGRRAERTS